MHGKFFKHRSVIWFLMAAALVVTGCEEIELSGKSCKADLDCFDADAGTAKLCVKGRCAVVECGLDTDCGTGVCHENRCTQICSQDEECPSGERCDIGTITKVCEFTGVPCTTNLDCGGGVGQCLQTSVGMCMTDNAVQVQDDGYKLHLGVTGDTTASQDNTLGPICSHLYDCACESSSSSDLCYGISEGYYSETGCQTILESIDSC